jgi:hypothetical protein
MHVVPSHVMVQGDFWGKSSGEKMHLLRCEIKVILLTLEE